MEITEIIDMDKLDQESREGTELVYETISTRENFEVY